MSAGPNVGGDDFVCDVLVVGSGAGGAPSAALLAEAGFDVLIVEEGDLVAQGEVVPFSLEQMSRQYRSAGVTAAIGRPAIAYTEACCAGGGTEINSGLWRRPPPDVLERWRNEHDIADFADDDLYPICDEIEAALSVQTVPGDPIAASVRLRDGAAALGWEHDEIPRWMIYDREEVGSGRRQTMTATYLPRARRAGARLLTGQRVDRIDIEHGRAHRARLTAAGGRRTTVRFGHAFVCAGAIQTPALLQRSGLRHRVGGSLAVHPTVKLAARFDHELNVPDDVPVHQVKEFSPALSFGGSASSPGLVALSLSDDWARFGSAVEQWKNIALYYAAITSEGRGRVLAVPGLRDPLVTYRLTRRDRAVLGAGLARLALVMLEAGAREVYPGCAGTPVVRTRNDLGALRGTFSANRASVMTVHLCSTVPMGGDPRRSAAGSHGLVHGTSNVVVNDASLLPDAPGVNPQASVMAVAIRNVRRFVELTPRPGGSS